MQHLLLALSGETTISFFPEMANRHGLITGATGTGKTITLQKIIENFSSEGIPCIVTDIKGDLSGIAQEGGNHPKLQERFNMLGISPEYQAFPTVFWDVWGENGHPVRTTISEMGPLLLSRLLGLNETQSAVLTLTFKVADDEGLALVDLKDLRSMVQYIADRAKDLSKIYGNVSAASIGAIQRSLLTLESQGADQLFGEPSLNVHDLIQTVDGQGVINLLHATKLMNTPKLYSSMLLWLLSEIFELLPESGDSKRPKLLFFFDEAHLLFDHAPDILLEKIEQVVRLIRSKGVGVFFITQHPADIPEKISAQLGNRITHALRAYTPKEMQALKTAAETFRDNPEFDEKKVLSQLGVGEAMISMLDEKGVPGITQRAYIVPPFSHVGPIDPFRRKELMNNSLVAGVYDTRVDSESAYEILHQRIENSRKEIPAKKDLPSSKRESTAEAFAKSAARAIGSQLGRAIIRGILGSIFKK